MKYKIGDIYISTAGVGYTIVSYDPQHDYYTVTVSNAFTTQLYSTADLDKYINHGIIKLMTVSTQLTIGDLYKFVDNSGLLNDVLYKYAEKDDQTYIFEYEDPFMLVECRIRFKEQWLMDQISKGKFVKVEKDLPLMPGVCMHDYITYIGFTDIYDYCRHCGVKK